MNELQKPPEEMPERKRRLIDATVKLMLHNGYSGTTVDQICAESGVSKGSFFHYFTSKDDICRTAMEAWSSGWEQILLQARFDEIDDPLERVERLFDTMEQAYLNSPVGPGCLVGTVAQERSVPDETYRNVCRNHFERWVDGAARLLNDAKQAYPPQVDFDPVEVAWWLQSFVQGTLLIAKARQDPEFIRANVRHCRAYVIGLFGRT